MLMMLACTGILNRGLWQPLRWAAQRGRYKGTGKILIPHKSWPCGMAGGHAGAGKRRAGV